VIGLLIPIVIVVAIVVATRRHAGTTAAGAPPVVVDALLDRWQDAGLISPDQRAAILAHEEARTPAAPPAMARGPIVAEVLGYLGAVLAIVGVGIVVARANLSDLQGAVLAVVLGVLLTGLSFAVPEERGGSWWRFRQVVALLGLVGLVVATGLAVGGEDLAHRSGSVTAFACGAVALGVGSILHAGRDRPLPLLACFAGLVAAVLGATTSWDTDGIATAAGLTVAAIAWGAAAWRGWLRPSWLSLGLGTGLAILALAPLAELRGLLGWALATTVSGILLLTAYRLRRGAVLVVALLLGPIVLSAAVTEAHALWAAAAVGVFLAAFGLVALRTAWPARDAEAVAMQVYGSAALLLPAGIVWGAAASRSSLGLAALILGLAGSIALIVAGATRDRPWPTAVGLGGSLVYAALIAGRFARGRAVPVLLVVVGILGIAGAVRALRHRSAPPSAPLLGP
jgi:hypothetical protein